MDRLPTVLHQIQESLSNLPRSICQSCATLSQRIADLRSELMVAKLEAQRLREQNQALLARKPGEALTPAKRAHRKKRSLDA